MHYPLTDNQADFEINRPVRYQITAKKNYFHSRTDSRTDGRTDVAFDNNRYFFFEKKEKQTTKNRITFFNFCRKIDCSCKKYLCLKNGCFKQAT